MDAEDDLLGGSCAFGDGHLYIFTKAIWYRGYKYFKNTDYQEKRCRYEVMKGSDEGFTNKFS